MHPRCLRKGEDRAWPTQRDGAGLLRTLNHAQPGPENRHKRDRLGCCSRRIVLEAKRRFALHNCNSHGQIYKLDLSSSTRRRRRRRRRSRKLYYQKRTLGPGAADSAVASASQPTISEISWTSDLTSFTLVLLERSWLNFATRHGCLDTWTLAGRVILGNWRKCDSLLDALLPRAMNL